MLDSTLQGPTHLPGVMTPLPDSDSMPNFSDCNELVVVCCHAIWLGGSTDGADESEWCETLLPLF